jgi:hypothetical protein
LHALIQELEAWQAPNVDQIGSLHALIQELEAWQAPNVDQTENQKPTTAAQDNVPAEKQKRGVKRTAEVHDSAGASEDGGGESPPKIKSEHPHPADEDDLEWDALVKELERQARSEVAEQSHRADEDDDDDDSSEVWAEQADEDDDRDEDGNYIGAGMSLLMAFGSEEERNFNTMEPEDFLKWHRSRST